MPEPRRLFFFTFPLSGDEEDRTPDPLLARQVLSQLSYTPTGLQGFRYASVFLEVLIQTLKIKQHLLDFLPLY